jgi:hypothetical protein
MCAVYQGWLDSGGVLGWYIPEVVKGASFPGIMIGEVLPATTPERWREVMGTSPYEVARDLYPSEISRTLQAASVAEQLGAAVLFDRDVDSMILACAKRNQSSDAQAAAVGEINLALPYVAGIPRKQILELRNAIPENFKQFRAVMHDIVLNAMQGGEPRALEIAEARIDREVRNSLALLESEMRAVAKKTRIIGWGIPAVLTSGILAGSVLNVGDPAMTLTAGSAAAVAALNAFADSAAARERARGNPFYFIWRATKP